MPAFAPGRHVELPGRGTTFIRELRGPWADAPTVVLVHGWAATAGVNWQRSMAALAESFNVVAIDLRGHGRGLRDGTPFTYADCADDIAALVGVLDRGPVTLAGYSIGGPIAALVAKRHPEVVSGLVLVSATARDHNNLVERVVYAALHVLFRHLPDGVFTPWWVPDWMQRSRWMRPVDEMGRSDARRVVEAAIVAGSYDAGPWLATLTVPTAVVISARDLLVPPAQQHALAAVIPGATTLTLDGGHLAFLVRPARFSRAVAAACTSVVSSLSVDCPGRGPTIMDRARTQSRDARGSGISTDNHRGESWTVRVAPGGSRTPAGGTHRSL